MTQALPLREFRKAHKLTLRELAVRMELTEGQMSRIEREGTTSLPVAIKLSNITGLPVERFSKAEAA